MAVQFPAFCPKCGLIFASSFAMENVQGVMMAANRERCPRCRAWAELPEGTFDVVGDTIHVLSASALTRERLLRLQTILEAAQTGDITEQDAAQAVTEEAPELGPLLEKLRPKMRRALIVFLCAVIQILAAQALAESQDHSATKQDVQHAVEQAIQRCLTDRP